MMMRGDVESTIRNYTRAPNPISHQITTFIFLLSLTSDDDCFLIIGGETRQNGSDRFRQVQIDCLLEPDPELQNVTDPVAVRKLGNFNGGKSLIKRFLRVIIRHSATPT